MVPIRPSLLAPIVAACLGAPAPAQIPTVTVEWLPPLVAGEPDSEAIVSSINTDDNGGWIASVDYTTFARPASIYGYLPTAGMTEPGLLRTATTIGGFTQRSFTSSIVSGTSVGYVTSADLQQSAWVNDTLIARATEPVGSQPAVWTNVYGIQFGVNATPIVFGSAQGTGIVSDVVWNAATADFIVQAGDMIDAINLEVLGIRRFQTSPDGQHWAAIVTFNDPTSTPSLSYTILVDGETLLDPAGQPIRSGRAPSFQITTTGGTSRLGPIKELRVTNDGDCVFTCEDVVYQQTLLVRNGRVVRASVQHGLADVDQNGFAMMLRGQPMPFQLENVSLNRPSLSEVDFDGDGFVDSTWSLLGASATVDGPGGRSGAAFLEGSIALGAGFLRRSDGATTSAVVRLNLAQQPDVICGGVANSTGGPAHLRATGFDDAAYNDLTLQIADLPSNSFYVPLLSLTSSPPTQVPGSVGHICLGGSIGRLGTSAFPSNYIGALDVRIFTNFMPQPNGPVPVMPGDTWYAQVWYRDVINQMGTSNFSDAIAIEFR